MAISINMNEGVATPLTAVDAEQVAQQAVAAAQNLGAVLSGSNVQVSQTSGVEGRQSTGNATSVPELDEADEAQANQADLEALVAYLQMDMDEKMSETQAKRINSLKSQLENAHETQMSKIEKSIKEAREQEKAAKAQKAMGWLSAIFAVVVAVVVTVCTGGAAAGFAIAGAAIALGSQIMSETGATKAICKAIANSLREQHPNLSKAEADAAAQGILGGIELVLGLACGIGGGLASAGKAAATTAARVVKIATTASQITLQTGNAATTAASTAINYKAGMAQADATESQAYLNKINKLLEECEDDLQTILEQLTSAGTELLDLLESKTDTENKITQEIGMQNA